MWIHLFVGVPPALLPYIWVPVAKVPTPSYTLLLQSAFVRSFVTLGLPIPYLVP